MGGVEQNRDAGVETYQALMRTWQAWGLWIVAAGCAAGCSASAAATVDRSAPALRALPRVMLWAWQRPEDLRGLGAHRAGVAYLAATYHLSRTTVRIEPRTQPLFVDSDTPVVAVARIEVDHGTLLMIVLVDDLWVTANFKETQLRTMRPGQPVDIHVDAFNRDYHGTIDDLTGAAGTVFSLLPPENASGNFVKVVQRLPVRIRLEAAADLDHRLRPGMSVEARVRVQ